MGSLKAQNCQSCFTYAPDVNNSYLINLDATCSTVPANTNYEWFVDGQPYFGFPFPYFQIPFYTPGTYTITLVVSSASCVDSSSQSVTIVPSCNANFTSYQIGGGGVYFSHSGNYSPTATYTWDTGDGFTYSTQMMQHVYQTPGNYNVCLIVSDSALGGCSDTVCQTVSVTTSVQCIANLNYWLDPVTGVLSASASGSSYNINNYGFTYSLNGQIVQQGSSEFYNTILSNTGNYTLGLYVTDNANNPCDSIFQIVNFTNIFGTNCYPCFTTSYNATYDSVLGSDISARVELILTIAPPRGICGTA